MSVSKHKRIPQSCTSSSDWYPDIRKKNFTARVVKHSNRLFREVVDAPCLSVCKIHLDSALNSLLYLLFRPGVVSKLDLMIFVGLFQMNCSVPFCSVPLYSSRLDLTQLYPYAVAGYSCLVPGPPVSLAPRVSAQSEACSCCFPVCRFIQ